MKSFGTIINFIVKLYKNLILKICIDVLYHEWLMVLAVGERPRIRTFGSILFCLESLYFVHAYDNLSIRIYSLRNKKKNVLIYIIFYGFVY